MLENNLALRLRLYRSRAQLSVRQVANQLGISASLVTLYEQGKRRPKPATLDRLARMYGLSTSEVDDLYLISGRFPPRVSVSLLRTMVKEPRGAPRVRRHRRNPELAAYNVLEAFASISPMVWKSPPIPYERIARELFGYEIRLMNLRLLNEDILGALDIKARLIIIDSSRATSPLYAFTVCHEIGHLSMHASERPQSCTPGQATGLVEREADKFAASLLMPQPMVVRELNSAAQSGIELSAGDLARRFAVSRQMAELRLKELGR